MGLQNVMVKKLLVKYEIFLNQRKNRPAGFSGADSLPAIVNSFIYMETSSNHHGDNVLVGFERTDIIQISNITFYYNRFSVLTNGSLKAMGRFKI